MPSDKKINVVDCGDSNKAGISIAHRIAEIIRKKPNAVIGLATGSSPIPVYNELIRMHREEGLDFSKVVTFNLDEYFDLPADHSQSYKSFMNDNLFKFINIKPENTNFLDGNAKDVEAECERFEKKLKDAGYCDIWLLGIGRDGHIAFNEPGTDRNSRAHLVKLHDMTIKDNARFFDNNINLVPKAALTSGIATIMSAKEIVLIATGENKANAIRDAVCGPVTDKNPCSFLQEHPKACIFTDKDAAKLLN